jgi:NADPH2:quinone reductase
VVNLKSADFVSVAKGLTDGRGADVIYDPVGGEVLEKSMRVAAYGARLLVVGFTSGGPSRIMSNHVLIKGLSILGVRAGDRVIFGVRPGAFAEYVRVPASGNLMRLPAGWSDAEGSAFRVGAATAYHSLVHRAALKPREVLLVHGASGGVGMAAVQLGKHLGARVIATGSDDVRLAVVREQGADLVVNLRTADFVSIVKGMTDGRGANVIYDPVGGEVLEKSMHAAAYGARLLVVGFTSGGPTRIMSNHVLIKGLSILGVRAGETVRRAGPAFAKDYAVELPRLAGLGVMRPHISHRFPMERAADAFRVLIDRKVVGKAVILMSS